MKRIPFDLELAKAITNGEKEGRVVTRDKECVNIIYWDRNPQLQDNVIVALVGEADRVVTFRKNGYYRENEIGTGDDLFLEIPDEQEFKEGDVVFQRQEMCSWLSLLKDNVEYGEEIFTQDYVSIYVTGGNKGEIEYDSYSDAAEEIRLATPEERQMLIDALKKDGSDKAVEYLNKYLCSNNDSISKRVLSNLERIGKNMNTPDTPDSSIDYEELRVELTKIYSVEFAKLQYSSGIVFSELAEKSVGYADIVIEQLKKRR